MDTRQNEISPNRGGNTTEAQVPSTSNTRHDTTGRVPPQGSAKDTTQIPYDRKAMLAAALSYGRKGIPVFPLMAYTKKPFTSQGFKDATTDEDKIREWFSAKDHNIGIATGERSGLLVLDGDTYKSGVTDHPEWQSTIRDRSPRGGHHEWFRYPPGCGLTIGSNTPELGWDFRGEGGYIVAPPSIVSWQTTAPDDSTINHWGQAHWISGSLEDEVPFPPLGLLDRLRKGGPASAQPVAPPTWTSGQGGEGITDPEYWLDWALKKAKVNERSRWCSQMAYQMRDNGIPLEDALAAGIRYAETVFPWNPDDPYTAKDAQSTIRSAYKHPREGRTPCTPRAPRNSQLADRTKKRESTRLLEILNNKSLCRPFKLSGGELWVSYQNDSWEHARLESRTVEQWLAYQYHAMHDVTASVRSVKEALLAFAGYATRVAPIRDVYMRVAWFPNDTEWAKKITDKPTGTPGALILDLGGTYGVAVTADGWEVIELPDEIAFYRPTGYEAMPKPVHGGSLDTLRPYLNCPGSEGDSNFHRLLAWVIGCYQPDGAQPGIQLVGPPGAGKTTIAWTLRQLIDPNQTVLSHSPKGEEEMIFQGLRAWVVGFDNLEEVPSWMSNALCRFSTGEGDCKRKLYTDDEPFLVQMKRPVITTSLHPLIPREDMASRYFVVSLPEIKKGEHGYTETEYKRQVKEILPEVLGALMDVFVHAIGNLQEVCRTTKGRYRLGDYHLWLKAAEPALKWPEGTADTIMEQQNAEALQIAIDQYAPLRVMDSWLREGYRRTPEYSPKIAHYGLEKQGIFVGKAETLLKCLTEYAREVTGLATLNDKVGWPQQPKKLAAMLRGSTRALEAMGIKVHERISHHNTVFDIRLMDTGGSPGESPGSQGSENICSLPGLKPEYSRAGGVRGVRGGTSYTFIGEKEREEERERGSESDSLGSPHSPNSDFNGAQTGESGGESEWSHSPLHEEASTQDFTKQPCRASGDTTANGATVVGGVCTDACRTPRVQGGLPDWMWTQGWQKLDRAAHSRGSPSARLPDWERAYALLPRCPDDFHPHSGMTCPESGLPVKLYPRPLPKSPMRFKLDEHGRVVGACVPLALSGARYLDAAICALALERGRPIDSVYFQAYATLVRKAESVWQATQQGADHQSTIERPLTCGWDQGGADDGTT